MIATAHLAAGAAIGMVGYHTGRKPLPTIAGVFLAGIASHVFLDRIPHEDYALIFNARDGELATVPLFAIVVFEEVVASLLAIWNLGIRDTDMPSKLAILTLAGMAGSALPDIRFVALFCDWQWLMPLVKASAVLHQYFHAPHSPNLLGLLTEIVMTGLCYWLIYQLRPNPYPAQNRL